MIHIKLQTLALASILTLPLATTACSPGHSPTEPAFDDPVANTSAVSASSSTLSSATDESRRGRGGKDDGTTKNDDNKNDDKNNNKGNRGRGRGGNGGDDNGNKAPRGGQEFEAAVSSVGSSSLTLANGVRIVVNGSTQWSGRGDLFTLDQVAGSLAAGRHPRIEGRGTRQSDGSILATTIKAEDEEDD
jgi:hypothetical protein